MTPTQRKVLRLILELERERARADYAAVGEPFGEEGLDIWIEYEQLTTVN